MGLETGEWCRCRSLPITPPASLRSHGSRPRPNRHKSIFNIVWRYTYSIRLFLIEAKQRYKGKNINRKHTLKILKVQKVYTQDFLILRHPIKLTLDPLLGYQREERLYFLNRQRNRYFFVEKRCVCSNKSCVRSFAGCADLNLAGICWVSSPCCRFSDAVMTIFSGQSAISRVYTSRFGNGTDRLEPRLRWY